MNTPTVLIVDSYSATNLGRESLLDKFNDAGVQCVRVQSSPELPTMFQLPTNIASYVGNIIHNGNLDETVTAVSQYSPVAVITGSDVGVEFADTLSERLSLPTNGTAKSIARRDKYEMIEAVRDAGLNASVQIKIKDVDHIREWHSELGGRVVLKPVRGGGGSGVHFCDTVDQSVNAYCEVIASGNIYTDHNEAVVAQEYLVGTEYMVNSVSSDGTHHICDIWQTNRLSANNVLDLCGSISILPHDRKPADTLCAYANDVLDALGIRFGPAHLEIIITPKGPYLVEIGARPAGGDLQHNTVLCTGECQLDWTVDAYVRRERFNNRCNDPYQVKNFYTSVALVSPLSGHLSRYRHLDEIQKLESLYEIRQLVKPGEKLLKTVDDYSYPVLVNLMHPVEEVVQRDAETIRFLDGSDFYQLAEEPVAVIA
ncbi:MAG: biotin carboxylase [Hyphomicrobiales bacterium]|nr:MAG: biotin carboxylase [Hyphomicrobiales bacterium]